MHSPYDDVRAVFSLLLAVGLIIAIDVLAAVIGGSRRHLVRAENLCHQAIFMNHASGAVAPPEAERVQVGNAIGQRAQRRGLVQGGCGRCVL
jgi:hypothetical protein